MQALGRNGFQKETLHYSCRGIYSKFIKRSIDFALSLICIVLLIPVFTTVALLVRINLGRPIIFRQERVGLNDKTFTIYKFRTMTDERDEKGELLPNCDRLTKFGRFLRSTSLDELPELFNILKGDMSFVGPRPLLVEYLPLYNSWQRRRHEVRPGLTGLAQVNGRNTISWEEKFGFDVEYVDNVTFILDLKIILRTVTAVVKREGIDSSSTVTMAKFQGTASEGSRNTESMLDC